MSKRKRLAWLLLGLYLSLVAWAIKTKYSGIVHSVAPVSHCPAPAIDPDVLETVKGFTVLISDEGFGRVSRGTGVIIDSTHVLTCAHMVPNDGSMWIYTYPLHRVVMGKPIFGDRFHDLAIIELSEPVILDQYAIFKTKYTLGQPILVLGNILGGMRWFSSYGILSASADFYLMTDAVSHGGNSGGPWVDFDGNVLALTDWGLEMNHKELGIGGGIKAETIQQFLKNWKNPNLLQILLGG
jgi:S1-C subfamily serine protease